jgi:hypothetical protein
MIWKDDSVWSDGLEGADYSEIIPRIRLEMMTKTNRSFSQNSKYSLPRFRVVVPIANLYLYTNFLDNCDVLTL